MTTAVIEKEPVVSDSEDDSLSDKIRRPLTASDRCDGPGLSKRYDGYVNRCGAQAFVRVQLQNGDLLFCGHHFAFYEYIFASHGYPIQDEREKINVNPFSEGQL